MRRQETENKRNGGGEDMREGAKRGLDEQSGRREETETGLVQKPEPEGKG